MNRSKYKKLFFLLWLVILCFAVLTFFNLGIPLQEYPLRIQQFMSDFGVWAGIIYVVFFAIRPLVFFPASILTAASGLLFGPWLGILYTLIGENFSANFAFIVGRYFGNDLKNKMTKDQENIKKIDCALKDNGFIAVLIMRLTYLPFDFVGYACGICNVSQRDFALGTFWGIIPGVVTFVLLGVSFSDPRNLMLVAGSLVVGLMMAKYLKQKEIIENKKRDDS
ncbi:MAG: TVP38/TMEM64 family protein [Methylococcales bacterium]|jgi:uncharacterized membrane protein YdjX (TVP38/TMEM64 family)|nr:TVP38/TMEM64 family protein [Methylococcales bacterium]MBT7409484.1 TVP38/TMEM64 family protein [Methylococcales bacterium]